MARYRAEIVKIRLSDEEMQRYTLASVRKTHTEFLQPLIETFINGGYEHLELMFRGFIQTLLADPAERGVRLLEYRRTLLEHLKYLTMAHPELGPVGGKWNSRLPQMIYEMHLATRLDCVFQTYAPREIFRQARAAILLQYLRQLETLSETHRRLQMRHSVAISAYGQDAHGDVTSLFGSDYQVNGRRVVFQTITAQTTTNDIRKHEHAFQIFLLRDPRPEILQLILNWSVLVQIGSASRLINETKDYDDARVRIHLLQLDATEPSILTDQGEQADVIAPVIAELIYDRGRLYMQMFESRVLAAFDWAIQQISNALIAHPSDPTWRSKSSD